MAIVRKSDFLSAEELSSAFHRDVWNMKAEFQKEDIKGNYVIVLVAATVDRDEETQKVMLVVTMLAMLKTKDKRYQILGVTYKKTSRVSGIFKSVHGFITNLRSFSGIFDDTIIFVAHESDHAMNDVYLELDRFETEKPIHNVFMMPSLIKCDYQCIQGCEIIGHEFNGEYSLSPKMKMAAIEHYRQVIMDKRLVLNPRRFVISTHPLVSDESIREIGVYKTFASQFINFVVYNHRTGVVDDHQNDDMIHLLIFACFILVTLDDVIELRANSIRRAPQSESVQIQNPLLDDIVVLDDADLSIQQ
jgi:hypothetical protein